MPEKSQKKHSIYLTFTGQDESEKQGMFPNSLFIIYSGILFGLCQTVILILVGLISQC